MMTDNLVTTGPKTMDRRSNSQAADYVNYDFQTIDEEEVTFIECIEGDPLEFGINNNQLSLDEVKDIEITNDDNDVEIMSSSQQLKKNSTRGQRSKSVESSSRQNKTESNRIKCEFCGKNLSKGYISKHIRAIHRSRQCCLCGLKFSFKNSFIDHKEICSGRVKIGI